jgi:hypothetical protein
MSTYSDDLAAMNAAIQTVLATMREFRDIFRDLGIPHVVLDPFMFKLGILEDYGVGNVYNLNNNLSDCMGNRGYYMPGDSRTYYDKSCWYLVPDFGPDVYTVCERLKGEVETYKTAQLVMYSYPEYRNELFQIIRRVIRECYSIELGDDDDHIEIIQRAVYSIPETENTDDKKRKLQVICVYNEYKTYRSYVQRRR